MKALTHLFLLNAQETQLPFCAVLHEPFAGASLRTMRQPPEVVTLRLIVRIAWMWTVPALRATPARYGGEYPSKPIDEPHGSPEALLVVCRIIVIFGKHRDADGSLAQATRGEVPGCSEKWAEEVVTHRRRMHEADMEASRSRVPHVPVSTEYLSCFLHSFGAGIVQ